MQTLTIDPAVPFILPPIASVLVVIVGCGGTGSYLAQNAARLAVHSRAGGGPEIQIILMDGDSVEEKNVGRQLFCPAEVGRNKAMTLAARLNAALGLKIAAIPEMATRESLDSALWQNGHGGQRIVMGAVDSPLARRAISVCIEPPRIWIDCGNHDLAGQIMVGSAPDLAALRGAFALGGICSALPSPALVRPDLVVEPRAKKRRAANCAIDLADNRQSLMINQVMATIASEYLTKLVLQRRITTFETVVDLASLSMRSLPITATNVAQACGIERDLLTTLPASKKGRAA